MTGRSSSLTQMVSMNDHKHARPSKHITDIYHSLQIEMDGTKALQKEIALCRGCRKPGNSSLFLPN